MYKRIFKTYKAPCYEKIYMYIVIFLFYLCRNQIISSKGENLSGCYILKYYIYNDKNF